MEAHRVLDPTRLALTDGRELVLAAVEPGDRPIGPDPADALLERLAIGRALTVWDGQTDRHGRLRAQVSTAEGLWLQEALVRAGALRVAPLAADATAAPALLAAESEARSAGRGLWADLSNRVLDATRSEGPRNRFQIVEGRVTGAEIRDGTAYLDFGTDWRRDFTVAIAPQVLRRAFRDMALERVAGCRLRVRGWLYWRFGPRIDLDHPAQMEVLDPDCPAAAQ